MKIKMKKFWLIVSLWIFSICLLLYKIHYLKNKPWEIVVSTNKTDRSNLVVDGINDQDEISLAFSLCPNRGCRVIMESGNYYLTNSIVIDKENVIFDGDNGAVLYNEDSSDPVFNVDDINKMVNDRYNYE